jgi:hypothetical protein
MLRHLSRLARLRELALPPGIGERAHAGRLAGLAREGAQMSIQHLRDLEASRRYATLVALVIDTEATVTDQIREQHDRLLGRIFADARRKHEQRFSAAGKDINDTRCACTRSSAMP